MELSCTSGKIMAWARRVASPSEVTLYLRHIPSDYTKANFQALISTAGYDGEYDYFYLPRCFHTKMCKGYAFINLSTEEAAQGLTEALEGTQMWHGCLLSVSRSATQGLADNLSKWVHTHSCRVKDPEVLPSVGPLQRRGGAAAYAEIQLLLGLPSIDRAPPGPPRQRPLLEPAGGVAEAPRGAPSGPLPWGPDAARGRSAAAGAWHREEQPRPPSAAHAAQAGWAYADVGPRVQAPWRRDVEPAPEPDPARHGRWPASAAHHKDALLKACWREPHSTSCSTTDIGEVSLHSGGTAAFGRGARSPSSSCSDRQGDAWPGGAFAVAAQHGVPDLADIMVLARFSV